MRLVIIKNKKYCSLLNYKKMKIGIIAAINQDGVYAVESKSDLSPRKNGIPWDIPKDFKNFKAITLKNGKNAVVMGFTTKENIPSFLKGRINSVITSKETVYQDGTITSKSIQDAINDIKKINPDTEEIWFIGGKGIWEEALKIADIVMLTTVEKEIPENEIVFKCKALLSINLEKDFKIKEGPFTDFLNDPNYSITFYEKREKENSL